MNGERYRTGAHWPVTIIEVGAGELDEQSGRREGDRLMGVAQTPGDAARITRALNAGNVLDHFGIGPDRDGSALDMQCLLGDGEGGGCAFNRSVEQGSDWTTFGQLAQIASEHVERDH